MSDETLKQSEARKDAGTVAAGVSGAVALVLCCGEGWLRPVSVSALSQRFLSIRGSCSPLC
jgi:hypothetical protein